MATTELVLVDTCIWIPFFNRPHSREKQALDALLDDDSAALIGPILAEVLQGFRRDEHADWVASVMRGARYLHTEWEHWRSAARLGRQLAAQGSVLPLSDLAAASVALANQHALWSNDPHFDLFPDLKRFRLHED